ncbi:venom serine protease-like [Condylostylus longicornis]|uniref:venom serine protease-like n=1 Tax=Condylostylus longicornis TaxID=2530218 RepID=UPI00244E0710|nr:venom serine protease-like [Condylostylus longicornis]
MHLTGVLWIIKNVQGLFEYCDYRLQLNSSMPKIYINSPNYPNNYPSGSSCRFLIKTSSSDYRIKFNCRIDFDKNSDNSCSTENFYFNNQGSTVIPGSEFFCGNGNFKRKSVNDKATISYISTSSNQTGWFSCLAEMERINCNCGWSNPNSNQVSARIVGGKPSKVNEFPFLVGILHLAYQRIFCGATIIHKKYLLSAAHCYSSNETNDPEELNALVGDNDFTIRNRFTKLYDIEYIIYHEDYDSDKVTNDIAILKTTKDIAFNSGVGPACLPFKFSTKDFVGSKVITGGWGTISFGGLQPNSLQKVNLDIISIMECQVKIKHLNFGQFCTFTKGKDACQFDSGGGLFYKSNGLYYVVGIVSFGFSCATNFPSVNTRVSTYLFWIQNKLQDVKFCRKLNLVSV